MNSGGYGAWKGVFEGAGYLTMLPATLQFLIVMIASAINDRLRRKLDYVEEERRILQWRGTARSAVFRSHPARSPRKVKTNETGHFHRDGPVPNGIADPRFSKIRSI